MGYPGLTSERAQELANQLIAASESGENLLEIFLDESAYVTEKVGQNYERDHVISCGSKLRSTWEDLTKEGKASPSSGYSLESKMAGEVHNCLSMLHIDMREDEDFWRYLALFPLRWYLLAREPEMKPQDIAGYVYVPVDEEGGVRREKKPLITHLIFRTYLWGKVAFDESNPRGKYGRATVLDEIGGPSIDVWHSHMIRTQLGQLGEMPHAFIDVISADISDPEKIKNPARKTEKLIARMKHNILFDVYQKSTADSIVKEQLGNVGA